MILQQTEQEEEETRSNEWAAFLVAMVLQQTEQEEEETRLIERVSLIRRAND